jgi:hypothetical protein
MWQALADAFRTKYYQEIMSIGRELEVFKNNIPLSSGILS